ncbi:FAD:protein FMN transferase [Amnibacterium sp.]|uniref:FAD:protein FMN transferase n=1 Tax=Amnibacterium sp. TaxID=1872496 RepID=UPI003F7CA851
MNSLHRTEWRAVGTTCAAAVTADSHDEVEVHWALAAAREEVAACEGELSRFDPSSDLSRLNAADGDWVPIGRRLFEAIRLALRAREETGGRFDPTILPALTAAGYDRSFELLEERQARSADYWRAGAEVELDDRRGRARLEWGAAVDLGGIGKGYAARRALAAMLAASPSFAGGLVDLGGDIAVSGESPEAGPWVVAVADPRQAGETLAILAVPAGGVATSGRDARRFGPARSLHHLIDPETGEPALAGPLTVTVVAPDAAEAEVHATTLAIAGLAEAEEYVAARPSISALYVPHAGSAIPLGRLPLGSQRFVVRAA